VPRIVTVRGWCAADVDGGALLVGATVALLVDVEGGVFDGLTAWCVVLVQPDSPIAIDTAMIADPRQPR